MRAFAGQLREDLRGTGVGVTLIAPSEVDLPYFENNPGSRERIPRAVALLGGAVTPEVVACAMANAIERDRGDRAAQGRGHRAADAAAGAQLAGPTHGLAPGRRTTALRPLQAGPIALQGTAGAGGCRSTAPAGSGSYAIQLAKRLGAHVTGVDNAAKLEFMRSLGADATFDYRNQDFTQAASATT